MTATLYFFSLSRTYKTLFWTLFNYEGPENADIVVGNEHNPNVTVKHKMTEGFGYALYGAYNVVCVIVLLNMLIAMMAHSYEAIEVCCSFIFAKNLVTS